MIIVPQFINTRIGGTNIKHYKELGYKIKLFDFLTVPVEHLPEGSHEKIQVQCDYCKKIISKQYKGLLNERKSSPIKKDCCLECKSIKTIESNMMLYGVPNVMNRDEVKEILKNSMIEKYGVEFCTQNAEIVGRASESRKNLPEEEKEDIRNKTIQTNLDKYGYEYYNQSPEGQERFKQTCLEKYGVENPNQNEEVRNKTKQTNIEKYGAENYFGSDIFKEYIKGFWFEKEGVDHYSKTQDFRNKMSLAWENMPIDIKKQINEKRRNTLIEKYGTNSIVAIAKTGFVLVNGTRTSSQQIKVYEYLLEQYPDWNICLNHLLDSTYYLDILMFKDDIFIDVEYDGYFWHIQERDDKRDAFVKSIGWKTFRIKSGYKLPNKELLYKELDCLISGSNSYKEIILDDWAIKMNFAEWRAE